MIADLFDDLFWPFHRNLIWHCFNLNGKFGSLLLQNSPNLHVTDTAKCDLYCNMQELLTIYNHTLHKVQDMGTCIIHFQGHIYKIYFAVLGLCRPPEGSDLEESRSWLSSQSSTWHSFFGICLAVVVYRTPTSVNGTAECILTGLGPLSISGLQHFVWYSWIIRHYILKYTCDVRLLLKVSVSVKNEHFFKKEHFF